jgi:hypothetical protein
MALSNKFQIPEGAKKRKKVVPPTEFESVPPA